MSPKDRDRQLELPLPTVDPTEVRDLFSDWSIKETPSYLNLVLERSTISIPKLKGGVFTFFPGNDVRMVSVVSVDQISFSRSREDLPKPDVLTVTSPFATFMYDKTHGTGEFRALGNLVAVVNFDLRVG